MTASPEDLAHGRLVMIMASDCLNLLVDRSGEATGGDLVTGAAMMLAAMQFMVARALVDLGVQPTVFLERVEATIRVLEQQQKASAS